VSLDRPPVNRFLRKLWTALRLGLEADLLLALQAGLLYAEGAADSEVAQRLGIDAHDLHVVRRSLEAAAELIARDDESVPSSGSAPI
jgi:hypothetical protein